MEEKRFSETEIAKKVLDGPCFFRLQTHSYVSIRISAYDDRIELILEVYFIRPHGYYCLQ